MRVTHQCGLTEEDRLTADVGSGEGCACGGTGSTQEIFTQGFEARTALEIESLFQPKTALKKVYFLKLPRATTMALDEEKCSRREVGE